MSVAAVVVAAGSGQRLGGLPKQFRPLAGHPMLAWSCELFAREAEVSQLVVVLPPDAAERPPEWLSAYDVELVAGGATRSESVSRGLAAVASAEVVAIHDAARPLASARLVARLLAVGRETGCVIPVLEIADAVKRVEGPDGSVVAGSLDRSVLRAAQTPQVFPAGMIRELHERAAASGTTTPDDAALAELAGIPVQVVPGERRAFKITRAEDLDLAEWLVSTGRAEFGGGAA